MIKPFSNSVWHNNGSIRQFKQVVYACWAENPVIMNNYKTYIRIHQGIGKIIKFGQNHILIGREFASLASACRSSPFDKNVLTLVLHSVHHERRGLRFPSGDPSAPVSSHDVTHNIFEQLIGGSSVQAIQTAPTTMQLTSRSCHKS